MAVMSVSAAVYGVVRRRKSQPQQSHKAGPTEVAVEEEEKDGLMEGQEHVDAPPSYSEEPEVPRV